MRVATWESSAGALGAFLNAADQCFMADLYTITLPGGTVLRYTSADVAIAINGQTFVLGPIIKRGKTKLSVGIAVDTLDVTMNADSTVTINGVPLLQFIAAGGLDGATVLLERAFSAGPGSAWIGTLGLFSGRVSDATISRYEAALQVSSDSELLNTMVPRNVYQPGCSNTLFDAACGISKAGRTYSVTAAAGSDTLRTSFNTSPTYPTGYFSQGWAVGTSGANTGVGRTIKAYASGVVTTIQPWPAVVGTGDGFVLYPGCDKQMATCNAKFGNLANFRGQCFVPAPETIT